MRFNEFDTHNNLETKLKRFFEGKISSKDFSSYIKENQITEADLLEGPLSAIFKTAPKVWNRFKDAFRGSKQSAPSAALKPDSSTASKVAGGAALGAAGTAAALGTGDDWTGDDWEGGAPGPDQAIGLPPGKAAKVLPSWTAAPKVPEPKPSGNMDDISFGQAFAAARKAHGGPGGKFTWRGKEYQTNIKGEKYAKNPTQVSFEAPKPAASAQQKLPRDEMNARRDQVQSKPNGIDPETFKDMMKDLEIDNTGIKTMNIPGKLKRIGADI